MKRAGKSMYQIPWPGMLRTTYGDHERCRLNYFSTYENLYFTGDGCLRDKNGNYRITGRVDDVLNVSGHRIGTAEVENAINMHAGVVESAVVGYPHEIKGQGIYAFVIFPALHNEQNLHETGYHAYSVPDHRSDCKTRQNSICKRLAKNTKWKDHATDIKKDRRRRNRESG